MSDLLAMQRAVWLSKRTAVEKMVLLAIMDFYSARSPEPWPSTSTLAARTSFGRTSVHRALTALEQDGVLGVRRVFGQSNRYDLSSVCSALAVDRRKDAALKPKRSVGSERQTLLPWATPSAVALGDTSQDEPPGGAGLIAATESDEPPSSGVQPVSTLRSEASARDSSRTVRAGVVACAACRELARRCSAASAPVCEADRSIEETRSTDEHPLFTCGTPPVPPANTKEPINEPNKEPTLASAESTPKAAKSAPRERDESQLRPEHSRRTPPPLMHGERIAEVQSLIVRAKVALADGAAAVGPKPAEWPETKQAAEAFSFATGQQRRLGDVTRDTGLRALLTLYAHGYGAEDVAWVAGTVPRQPWWQEGRHALASLSPRVVARALKERQEVELTNVERRGLSSEVAARHRPTSRDLQPQRASPRARTEPAFVSAEFRPAAEALATVLARIQGEFAIRGPSVRAAPRNPPGPNVKSA